LSKPFQLLLLASVVLCATGSSRASESDAGEAGVRRAAERLLVWLGSGSGEFPGDLLPVRGTVAIALRDRPGEDGSFGARQAVAVLSDARRRWSGRVPSVIAADLREGRVALVRGRLEVRDPPAAAELLMSFRWEDDRWVLREIRESAR